MGFDNGINIIKKVLIKKEKEKGIKRKIWTYAIYLLHRLHIYRQKVCLL